MFSRLLPAMVAAVLAIGSLGIVHRLSRLDGTADFDALLDPLVQGNLHELFVSGATWRAAPEALLAPECWTMTLGPLVATVMAALLGGVLWLAHRRRSAPTTTAWLCLATAIVPWGLARLMVRSVDEPQVGRWLAVMLGGLLLACLASVVVVGWSLRRPQPTSPVGAPVAAH